MTFFEQFEELRKKIPRPGLQVVQNENSPFCQYTEKSRNCYMTFASYQSEDCYYNHRVFYCTDCTDCALCYKCQLCYECLDCINCYNCNYCVNCEQCVDTWFSYFCTNTNNCFGCVGLRRKSFYIFNELYSKEEYEAKISELKKLPREEIFKKLESLLMAFPHIAMNGKNNENVSGDFVYQSKNAYWAFDSKNLEDCAYAYHCDDSKDLHDCSHLGWSQECFEIMSGGNLNNCSFCYGCWHSTDLEYCELLYNSRNCFGCIGLNHAEYQIFNVPYAKEEYFQKVAEIKAEMRRDGCFGRWPVSTYLEVLTYGL